VLPVDWHVAHNLINSLNVVEDRSINSAGTKSDSTIDVWAILCEREGFQWNFQHLSNVYILCSHFGQLLELPCESVHNYSAMQRNCSPV